MQQRRFQYVVPLSGFVVALLLHFWHIGTPTQLVSDEASFVPDGWNYVQRQVYFDPHPPLGKMVLGLSMQMFGRLPDVWRGVGAMEAALLVPLIWWIVRRLTRRTVAANLATLLMLFDGQMLVDARLGMINIPFILAAFIVVAAILKALDARRPAIWLAVAGTAIGAAIATKWLAGMVVVPALLLWWRPSWFGQAAQSTRTRRSTWTAIGWLVAWPLMIYWLVFIIHFAWLGVLPTVVQTNIDMLKYHLSVPSTGDPNAQPWWGWGLAWRPFPYWTESTSRTVSVLRSLPNPWLWWSGMVMFIVGLVRGWNNPVHRWLLVSLLCAWLPFAGIQRVMYSYHMLTFNVLLSMYIAVVVSGFWPHKKIFFWMYIGFAAVVFFWFIPWYLNLPLSVSSAHLREWLPSWRIQ